MLSPSLTRKEEGLDHGVGGRVRDPSLKAPAGKVAVKNMATKLGRVTGWAGPVARGLVPGAQEFRTHGGGGLRRRGCPIRVSPSGARTRQRAGTA